MSTAGQRHYVPPPLREKYSSVAKMDYGIAPPVKRLPAYNTQPKRTTYPNNPTRPAVFPTSNLSHPPGLNKSPTMARSNNNMMRRTSSSSAYSSASSSTVSTTTTTTRAPYNPSNQPPYRMDSASPYLDTLATSTSTTTTTTNTFVQYVHPPPRERHSGESHSRESHSNSSGLSTNNGKVPVNVPVNNENNRSNEMNEMNKRNEFDSTTTNVNASGYTTATTTSNSYPANNIKPAPTSLHLSRSDPTNNTVHTVYTSTNITNDGVGINGIVPSDSVIGSGTRNGDSANPSDGSTGSIPGFGAMTSTMTSTSSEPLHNFDSTMSTDPISGSNSDPISDPLSSDTHTVPGVPMDTAIPVSTAVTALNKLDFIDNRDLEPFHAVKQRLAQQQRHLQQQEQQRTPRVVHRHFMPLENVSKMASKQDLVTGFTRHSLYGVSGGAGDKIRAEILKYYDETTVWEIDQTLFREMMAAPNGQPFYNDWTQCNQWQISYCLTMYPNGREADCRGFVKWGIEFDNLPDSVVSVVAMLQLTMYGLTHSGQWVEIRSFKRPNVFTDEFPSIGNYKYSLRKDTLSEYTEMRIGVYCDVMDVEYNSSSDSDSDSGMEDEVIEFIPTPIRLEKHRQFEWCIEQRVLNAMKKEVCSW